MTKMRLRRLLEEILNGDLVQVDLEENTEPPPIGTFYDLKRVSLVVRFVPA